MDIAVTNFTVDIPKTLRADVPSYKPVAEVVSAVNTCLFLGK